MRTLITLIVLVGTLSLHAQNTIYSHAIGNWRNGPVVYISPLIETTEAETKPQLAQLFRREFPELRDLKDLDVLLFGTKEEGEESRRVLEMKYGLRRLKVVMLEVPAPAEDPNP